MIDIKKEDVEILGKAIKDKKCDEKAIIALCLRTDNAQRLKIKEEYDSQYSRNLINDFKRLLHDPLREAVIALFTEPIEYDAEELYKAINVKDEDSLIEIIASRPPEILEKIKDIYKIKYKRILEDDVSKKIKGEIRNLLLSLLQSNKRIKSQEDPKKIANEIFEAGEAKLGTDEKVFIKHFCNLCKEGFIHVNEEYEKISGNHSKHNLIQAVEKEFGKGDLKKILKTIVISMLDPPSYFTLRIYEALNESKVNTLTRVLVSRSDIDMKTINENYQRKINKDLYNDVKKKISGHYRVLMLGIIDKNLE